MTTPRILFGLLVAMCLVVGLALSMDEAPNRHGVSHERFDTMLQGGSAEAPHGTVVWLGWAFGVLQIGFFVGCLLLGLRDWQRHTWVFLLSGLLYALVFTWMVAADRQYAQADSPSLFLSFPLPTAVMLYGVWTVPVIFLVLYVVNFERWILRPEDLERLQNKLAANRPSQSDN